MILKLNLALLTKIQDLGLGLCLDHAILKPIRGENLLILNAAFVDVVC